MVNYNLRFMGSVGVLFWSIGALNPCDDCMQKCWAISLEPRKKKPLTFHYTGCLIGILMLAY